MPNCVKSIAEKKIGDLKIKEPNQAFSNEQIPEAGDKDINNTLRNIAQTQQVLNIRKEYGQEKMADWYVARIPPAAKLIAGKWITVAYDYKASVDEQQHSFAGTPWAAITETKWHCPSPIKRRRTRKP